MGLPLTGPLSLSDVNVELLRSATDEINLDDADVRTLFEVPTGAISFSDGRGKKNIFEFTITENQTNANLRTLAVNAGWNETSEVQATIGSGVTISGDTAGNSTAALTINGSFPNGVTLINDGLIVGRGGNGGSGGAATAAEFPDSGPTFLSAGNGTSGSTGGRALLVDVPVSIENNGAIRGGGGGGAGGPGHAAFWIYFFGGSIGCASRDDANGGGGGGGGRSSLFNSSGGGGGSASGTFSRGGFSGSSGTISSAGGAASTRSFTLTEGGDSPCNLTMTHRAGDAGSGGDWGASGGNAGAGSLNPQNSNCCSASSVQAGTPQTGGAAGQAVNGNANITWIETGTRTGPIV